MRRHVDHKVPGGKLLRLEVDLERDVIRSIRITGDFFMYPEPAITLLEEALKGTRTGDVDAVVNRFIEDNDVTIIGFGASDLADALRRCQG
ncbi:MAG: lipoate protein ligase C-terminal domain-containing protein [Candidatus Woesearchaeota archaeon]